MDQQRLFPKDHIEELKQRIDELENNIEVLNDILIEIADPIIKKLVKTVEKVLRKFPEEARQFGNDYNLNTFEEVCVMIQEGSMDDYFLMEQTIFSCCKDAYSELSGLDKRIINVVSDNLGISSKKLIYVDFCEYANNYSNKRITSALYNRY